MTNLLSRTALVAFIVLVCALLFAPNFLTQELQVVFKQEFTRIEGGRVIKSPVDAAVIRDFAMDRENGLRLFFPGTECRFEAAGRIPKEYRCVLQGRFITAARINEMTQANPELVDELRTSLLPHWIEKALGFRTKQGFKNLKIRLGLDLQGGVRAVFRADYESYLQRLKEKYEPRIAELKKKLESARTDSERNDIKRELDNIQETLALRDTRKLELLNEAQNVINKRLNNLNLSEPEVRVQEDSYSIGVDMPGVTNSSDVLQNLRKTVTVEYRIVNDEKTELLNGKYRAEMDRIMELHRQGRVDPLEIQYIIEGVRRDSGLKPEDGRIFLHWRRGAKRTSRTLPRDWRVLGPPVLDGDDMTNAEPSINPQNGFYQINFVLSGTGAATFGKVTRENTKKRLAILWGDRVVSDPQIQTPIEGGNGVITGEFDQKEAEEISAVIREGALPLPLELLSVSFIGPSLGQESIVAGVISIVAGFVLVIIFMAGYYKVAGLVANLALLLNVLIIAAILSLLEFTLTLPGFAGVILTVGMAVDANVIIYEKIKEELSSGKLASTAIEGGFRSSFWTILDSNVTTLIAAVILWKVGDEFGDSAIKGFSITLFFGLISSMFTALFVSRLVFDWMLRLVNMRSLPIGYGIKEPDAV